jgi:hypothetical protein
MMVMVKSFECESGDGWKGAKLAALCVGVSAYSEKSELKKLGNAVRDAEAMFKKMKDCSNCRVAIMRDPKDREIIDEYKKVNEASLKRANENVDVIKKQKEAISKNPYIDIESLSSLAKSGQ